MNIPSLRRRKQRPEEGRDILGLTFDQYLQSFTYNGVGFPIGYHQTLQGNREEVSSDFSGLVSGAMQRNGVVFACMLVRQLLFSEARFQFRSMRSGRPGDLFGTAELGVLERPWPNGTTGDLLGRMIQDADLAGNAFVLRRGNVLRRLRPDWVDIVLGSMTDSTVEAGDIDAEPLGYVYWPGGRGSGRDYEVLMRDEVAHFAPIPDPAASFRGMSWLAPIVREITADSAATVHKLKFFENGATPNTVVKLAPEIKQEAFEQWVRLFKADHDGVQNAYKTLFLGGGADVTVVGSDLQQLDFKSTQGAGETRIAAAAGVPPIIVGLSEGLASSTYSNYSQARRRLTDGTMRPLWRNAAGSLATIINVPPGSELWYDDRDIAFLMEDAKDRAEVFSTQAAALKSLLDAGFEADSAIAATLSGDFSLLKHTGLFSVQLQPPGTTMSGQPVSLGDGPAVPMVGNGKTKMPAALNSGKEKP